MKIRPISDIHLEFGKFALPVIEGEEKQVLCILGDLNPSSCLWEKEKGNKSTETFFKSISGRFRDVLYITGNHEYYHGDVNIDDDFFEDICDDFGFTFLQGGMHKDIKNTRFIGATLWTDFENGDPVCMYTCGTGMNDFRLIEDSSNNFRETIYGKQKLFTPEQALEKHYEHREAIFNKLSLTKKKKTVVMSHHAPSYESISENYRNSNMNGAYYSNLESEILETSPNLWLHGHCVDLNTEILTNKGWKFRKDLDTEEFVITLNSNTNNLEEVQIEKIIDISYSGNVYYYKGKGVNFRVTEDHCIFARNYHNTKYIEEPVSLFTNRKTAKFIRSGVLQTGGTKLNPNLLELYYAFAADGNTCNRATSGLVRFCVVKKRKLEYLKDLLNKCKIDFNEISQGFSFYLPEELKSFNIKGLDNFILESTPEECEIALKAYKNTDGNKNGNQVVIYSSKKEEVDLLQYMFTINGYKINCSYRDNHGHSKKRSYQLMVSKGETTSYQPCYNKIDIEKTDAEKFWCVKNINRNFFIRREGKVHLTGNCHQPFDYNIGKTRVVCNPRGYHGYEDTKYNSQLVIEV